MSEQENTRGTKDPASSKQEQPRKRTATAAQAAAGRANLLAFNASRSGKPRLVHGVKSTIASGGEIPAGIPGVAEEISTAAEEIIMQTVLDLGYETETEMPAQKRCLLSAQRLCLKILMLADRYITTEGLVIKGRANPLLTVAATYANSMRLNAEKLGLERVPRTVDATLEQVIAEHEGSEA
jgi:hypothetical protein